MLPFLFSLVWYEHTFTIMTIPFQWQAYDQHLNMILGDVEETVTSTEIDEETFEEIIKVSHLISK